MKTYDWTETAVDGAPDEWVPADVAQRLYDALSELVGVVDGNGSVEYAEGLWVEAGRALAAADGEEV